jgi:predicted metallo-beta-lactamase superfamily hydrolase
MMDELERTGKESTMTASVPDKIQTQQLLHISLEHYDYHDTFYYSLYLSVTTQQIENSFTTFVVL